MHDGHVISHYRIVSQLGRGGMGIVYKAEDTKLDRTVALKLLPPHTLVSEDDRARFYREARAAAALNHPNIAHVYEIDEADVESGESRPFIAMEYIDGETLSDVIARGPLPLKDAINYASQIAEGLKVAHPEVALQLGSAAASYTLTEDDEAIYYTGLPQAETEAEVTDTPDRAHPPVNVVVNWFEHVKKLSPLE